MSHRMAHDAENSNGTQHVYYVTSQVGWPDLVWVSCTFSLGMMFELMGIKKSGEYLHNSPVGLHQIHWVVCIRSVWSHLAACNFPCVTVVCPCWSWAYRKWLTVRLQLRVKVKSVNYHWSGDKRKVVRSTRVVLQCWPNPSWTIMCVPS